MNLLEQKRREIEASLHRVTIAQEAQNFTDVNDTEWAKSYMSRAKDLSTQYFKQLYDLENQINAQIKSVQGKYDFSELTNSLFNIIEEINQLIEVYSEGEKGNLNLKLSIKSVFADFQVDPPVKPIHDLLKQYIQVLQDFRAKAIELFTEASAGTNTNSEIYRKMAWELAYLGNATSFSVKNLTNIYNNEDVWVVQPFLLPESKPEAPQAVKPLEDIQEDTETKTDIPPIAVTETTPKGQPTPQGVELPQKPVIEQPKEPKVKKVKQPKQKPEVSPYQVGKETRVGIVTYKIMKVFPPGEMLDTQALLLKKFTSKGDKFFIYPVDGSRQPMEVQEKDKLSEFRSKE